MMNMSLQPHQHSGPYLTLSLDLQSTHRKIWTVRTDFAVECFDSPDLHRVKVT